MTTQAPTTSTSTTTTNAATKPVLTVELGGMTGPSLVVAAPSTSPAVLSVCTGSGLGRPASVVGLVGVMIIGGGVVGGGSIGSGSAVGGPVGGVVGGVVGGGVGIGGGHEDETVQIKTAYMST